MMTNTFIRDIQRNLKSALELQHQISTGKKVEYASDDPISADRILDYRQIIEETGQYIKNVNDADTLASNVDTVLGHMEDVLLRVRDLSVRASNEAPDNQQMRNAIANEIDSLVNQLVFESNQKFDGKSLFSGNKTTASPFVAKNYVDFVFGSQGNILANGLTNPFPPPANLNIAANGAAVVAMPGYTVDGATRTSEAIIDAGSVIEIWIVDDLGNRTLIPKPPTGFTVDPATNTINIADVGAKGLKCTDKLEVYFNKVVSVEYQGDTGVREYEIGEGSRIGVSYAGAVSDQSKQGSVFGKYSAEGTQTASVEAFQKLLDLRDSILKYQNVGGNIDDISRGIDDIDKIRTNITDIRSEQGGRVNRLELATNRLKSIELSTKDLKAKREEVDMAEAISQLMNVQTVYQACLGTGARIIQTTLLDFLR